MSADDTPEEQVEQLLQDFRLYDRNVDVVSAWEMIFTQSLTELCPEVAHFERFPSINTTDDRTATPDFTVLFNAGRAIVGEIANFALAEGSVDALCEQISRYAALEQIPSGGGGFAAVTTTDVMLLVPLNLGTAAVRRILLDRYARDDHFYAPSSPPVIVQFALQSDPEAYVFQRRAEAENGNFRDEGSPSEEARLSTWFARDDVRVKPERFRDIKVARAFMNDAIPPLYLATFLWAKIFADRAAVAGEGRPAPIECEPGVLASQIRDEYGVVRSRDVESALKLLERARLAERSPTGWTVYWTELTTASSDRDLAATLAQRSVRPPRRRVGGKSSLEQPEIREVPRQEPLF